MIKNFEKSMSELSTLIKTLEKGELSLDDALKNYEKGVKLTRTCQNALAEAEQKVQLLNKDSRLEPFEPADE